MSAAPFADLRNRHGERLDFTFHPGQPADSSRRDVVVIAHGVTSRKDRPWLVELAEAFAKEGIAALRFSFAGNGGSEGRFEDATLTKEVEDLGSVLDALRGWRIAYVGHSMGSAIGVLRASADPRIRALVSLAGMFHVQRFMQRHFGELVPGRDRMLGKEECPWTRELADDAKRIGSLDAQAARIEVPWLLVHGSMDEMVPLADSIDARAARCEADGTDDVANAPELVEIAGTDHRFAGAIHAMVDAVVPWVRRQLP